MGFPSLTRARFLCLGSNTRRVMYSFGILHTSQPIRPDPGPQQWKLPNTNYWYSFSICYARTWGAGVRWRSEAQWARAWSAWAPALSGCWRYSGTQSGLSSPPPSPLHPCRNKQIILIGRQTWLFSSDWLLDLFSLSLIRFGGSNSQPLTVLILRSNHPLF